MVKYIKIRTLDNSSELCKPEIKLGSKEDLIKLAREWGYKIFVQDFNTLTYYFMLTPNYIFYVEERKKK